MRILREACQDRRLCSRLVRLSGRAVANGKAGTRLSFRSSADFGRRINDAADHCGGWTVSDLTRGAILAAKEDLIDGKSKSRREMLEAVAKTL